MSDVQVLHGDALELLPTLDAASVDSVCTDPPYELAFMGRTWDASGIAYSVELWRECLRVLKPGGYLLAFGGTRTHHRLACAIEDAGFEIRDSLAWLYGSGFAKSWNFKTQFTGDWCGCNAVPYSHASDSDLHHLRDGVSATAEPRGEGQGADLFAEVQWGESGPGLGATRQQGSGGVVAGNGGGIPAEDPRRGQSLLAGRELSGRQGLPPREDAGPPEGAAERLRPGARAGSGEDARPPAEARRGSASHQPDSGRQPAGESEGLRQPLRALDDRTLRDRPVCPRCGGLDPVYRGFGTALKPSFEPIVVARKPLAGTVAANVLAHGTGVLNIDGCRVGDDLITQHGRNDSPNSSMSGRNYAESAGRLWSGRWPPNVVLDEAAAAEVDRQSGTSVTPTKVTRGAGGQHGTYSPIGRQENVACYGDAGGASRFFPTFRYEPKAPADERPRVNGTSHPTVKPLDLMRWLVRLVTPPGGLVLDPFAGSGTTGEACLIEGFDAVLIEREADYLPLIRARLDKPIQMTLGGGAA